MNKLAILEGLLFIKGEEGLDIDEISSILEIDNLESESLILELDEELKKDNRGINLSILGNKYKFTTKEEHKSYYQKLIEVSSNTLTQSSLETLAIIAYNKGITRSQIDDIRGVDSAHMVRKLVRLNLVKEIGRSELPGRPILYDTTSNFLDYFGLSDISQLPKLKEEIKEEDVDLFNSKYSEVDK
ncbi:MAG: SMC-Scp complex subunit ScpB [Mycoplasmatota bacterium]